MDYRHNNDSLPEDVPNWVSELEWVQVPPNRSFSYPLSSGSSGTCRPNYTRRFGEGLSGKTILCFLAMRPTNSLINRYLDLIDPDQVLLNNMDYHLAYICMRGKNKLEDWSTIVHKDGTVYSDFSGKVEPFQYIIMVILILFLPLILLKVVPWEEEENKSSINVIMEEAKQYIFEGENEREIIDVKENGGNCIGDIRNLVLHDRDLMKCKILLEGNHQAQVSVTIQARKKPDVKLRWYERIFDMASNTEVMQWVWDSRISHQNVNVMKGHANDINEKAIVMNGHAKEISGTNRATSQKNGYKTEEYTVENDKLAEELDQIKAKFKFVVLDGSYPQLFGFRSLAVGKVGSSFGPIGTVFLTMLRRFLAIILSSCGAFILMGILDSVFFKETIRNLMEFRNEKVVEVRDLRIWNYFTHSGYSSESHMWNLTWEMLYYIMACYWFLSVLILSFPGITSLCIRYFQPSLYFGFFYVVTNPIRYASGLKLLHIYITQRLGLMFNPVFWRKFAAQAFGSDKIFGELSTKRIIKGIVSLICIPSFLPIVAIFPPLYSWSRKFWPQKTLFFLVSALSCTVLTYLIIISLNVYLHFFIFTISSLLFHYQVTVSVVSIIIGCLGFIISMRNQFKNAYLADKMLILEIVTEVHEAKLAQFEDVRTQVTKYNEKNPSHKIYVPELLWWWSWKNWPCIPKQFYRSTVAKIRPLGLERGKFTIKLCIMGVFIAFITTVMHALGMDHHDSAFDAVRMLITVIAVIGPSFIAKFYSDEEMAISLVQKRGIVRGEVEKFLAKNKLYYNYDFDMKLESECEKMNQV